MKRHSTRLSPGVIFLLVLYGLICSVLWYHGYLEHIAYQTVSVLSAVSSKQEIDGTYFLSVESLIPESGYFTVECSEEVYRSVICSEDVIYSMTIMCRPFDPSICYLEDFDLEDYFDLRNK